ncbi:MAG: hypothetical protein ACHREM_06605 [Polyangiales bacterium]
MATYTDIIETRDDVTLREFALRCAHGMAILYSPHNESLDNELEVPPLDTSYVDGAVDARLRLAGLKAMTDQERAEMFEAKCREIAHFNRDQAEARESADGLFARYTRMKALVEAWSPPATAAGDGLKLQMLRQLENACDRVVRLAVVTPPATADALFRQLVDADEKEISWNERSAQAARQNHDAAIAFLKALHESLPEGKAPATPSAAAGA